MISRTRLFRIDRDSQALLEHVSLIRDGFELDPPELDPVALESWFEEQGLTPKWLEGLKTTERVVGEMAAKFMRLNPREAVQQELLVGIERVSQRIFAGRFGKELVDANEVKRIGSGSHLKGFLNQKDIHGKHPVLSNHVMHEWLRCSRICPSRWHCEPTLEMGFIGRIILTVPIIKELWTNAIGDNSFPSAKMCIPLLSGMLLHELVSHPERVRLWLKVSSKSDGEMSVGLVIPEFRELLSVLGRDVNEMLRENELDKIIGVLDDNDSWQILEKICDVFEFADAWHLCLELFYMLGPIKILDSILLICPDEKDAYYQATA